MSVLRSIPLVFLVFLMGCSWGRGTETIATSSTAGNITATATDDMLPIETPTLAPTRTLLATIPQIMTLSPEEALRQANFLMQTDECQLPCWNSVTPGQTSPSDLPKFFAELGYPTSLQEAVEFEAGTFALSGRIIEHPAPQGLLPPRVTVFWKDGPVLASAISWDWLPDFLALESISTHLGTPNEIYVSTSGQGEALRYTIVLEYRSVQTAIVLTGTSTSGYDEDNEWKREVCLTNSEDPTASVRMYSEVVNPLAFINFASEVFDWNSEIGTSEDRLFQELEDPVQCVTLPER